MSMTWTGRKGRLGRGLISLSICLAAGCAAPNRAHPLLVGSHAPVPRGGLRWNRAVVQTGTGAATTVGERGAGRPQDGSPGVGDPRQAGATREGGAEAHGEAGTGVGADLDLATAHARLAKVSGAEFTGAVEAMLAAGSPAVYQAVFLRAGSPLPPGLTAAQSDRRERLRTDALDLLHEHLTVEDPGPWRDQLVRTMLDAEADPELRCAALWIPARLDLLDLAPVAAGALADQGYVRETARSVLFRLFARWFDGPEDFEGFWSAGGAVSPPLVRAHLAKVEGARVALLLELLHERPDLAQRAFDERDPGVRAAAAGVLAEAVLERRTPVEAAIGAVLAQLERELDAHAFHAELDSLLSLVQGAQPDSVHVTNLRAALMAVAADGARAHQYGSVLGAIPRLPWTAEGDGPSSIASGIGWGAELFARLVERSQPLDGAPVLQGLDALRGLCARAQVSEKEFASLAHRASAPMRKLLANAEASDEVRIAAAGALSLVLFDFDVPELVAELRREDTPPELLFELLGSLGRAAADLDPGSDGANAFLDALGARVSDPNVDLRARAIEILGGPGLAPHVAARRWSDPAWLVETLLGQLEKERSPALQARLLDLTGRFPDPALVSRILALEEFEALAAGGARLEALTAALERLADGRAPLVFGSAERILAGGDASPAGTAASRIARLEAALGMILALEPEALADLTDVQHLRAVRWVLELRGLEGSPAGGAEPVRPHLDRVVDVHLRQAARGAGLDPRALAAERALLSGDRYLVTRAGGNAAQVVLDAYAEALVAAAAGVPGAVGIGVETLRRDRARFCAAAGRAQQALTDYRALIAAESGEGASPILDLNDLRVAADLAAAAAAAPEPAASRVAMGEAADMSWALVTRPGWKREPERLRLEDLERVVARSLASFDDARVDRALRVFARLPDAVQAETANGYRAGALWSGLTRKATSHRQLVRLRDSLQARVADTQGDGQRGGEGPGGDLGPDSRERLRGG